MTDIKATLKAMPSRDKRRHIIALLLILACCLGLFAWAGYTYLPNTVGASRRLIINDDYTTLTPALGEGDDVWQNLFFTDTLYGVVLNVHTFGHAVKGTLRLEVYDDQLYNGEWNLLAQSTTDMSTLPQDGFHWFYFDEAITASQAGRYCHLRIVLEPKNAEDKIAFYRSDGEPEEYEEHVAARGGRHMVPLSDIGYWFMRVNDERVGGMVALQYITHHSGAFLAGPFAFFSAFLTVLLLALYVLLFVLRLQIHHIFLVACLGLGLVFSFLIPPRAGPDEYIHIATVYHNSNVILGTDELDTESMIGVRPGDEMYIYHFEEDSSTLFAWQDMAENLFTGTPGGDMVQIGGRSAGGMVFPLLYAVQTLGVVLARLLGLSRTGLLLAGSLANLVFYAVLVSRAVKRIPLGKASLALAALLPMALQLASSFSYDTYVIALCFYFLATCLDYALNQKSLGLPQIILLGVLALLIAPAKAVYPFMLAILFVIPANLYPSKTVAAASRAATLVLAAALWAIFNSSGLGHSVASATVALQPQAAAGVLSLAPQTGAANNGILLTRVGDILPEGVGLQPNGDADQFFTLPYILGHIPQALRVLALTLWEQLPLWLQGLVGGRLGEIIAVDIEINWIFVIALLGLLLASAIPTAQDAHSLTKKQRVLSLGTALAVAAAFLLACLTWTPVNYVTLFGVQGRYLLPVLPLVLLALRGANLQFKKPVWRGLMFAACILVVLVQLDAFAVISQR